MTRKLLLRERQVNINGTGRIVGKVTGSSDGNYKVLREKWLKKVDWNGNLSMGKY